MSEEGKKVEKAARIGSTKAKAQVLISYRTPMTNNMSPSSRTSTRASATSSLLPNESGIMFVSSNSCTQDEPRAYRLPQFEPGIEGSNLERG